jgi:hypothetical protein
MTALPAADKARLSELATTWTLDPPLLKRATASLNKPQPQGTWNFQLPLGSALEQIHWPEQIGDVKRPPVPKALLDEVLVDLRPFSQLKV